MRVAIYARVSTSTNGQDPMMQTRELRELLRFTAAGPSPGEYVDIGISGSKEKRPELDRLMQDAHRPAAKNRGRCQDSRTAHAGPFLSKPIRHPARLSS